MLTVRNGRNRALVLIQVLTPGRGIDRDEAKRKCEAETTQACSMNKLCIRMKAAGQPLKLAGILWPSTESGLTPRLLLQISAMLIE